MSPETTKQKIWEGNSRERSLPLHIKTAVLWGHSQAGLTSRAGKMLASSSVKPHQGQILRFAARHLGEFWLSCHLRSKGSTRRSIMNCFYKKTILDFMWYTWLNKNTFEKSWLYDANFLCQLSLSLKQFPDTFVPKSFLHNKYSFQLILGWLCSVGMRSSAQASFQSSNLTHPLFEQLSKNKDLIRDFHF